MAPKKDNESILKPFEGKNNSYDMSIKKETNKVAWTVEEDQKLAEVITIHGARRWKTIAAIAGTYIYTHEKNQRP